MVLVGTIRHIDFDALVLINKEVVSLTGETHEFTEEDEERVRKLLKEVNMVTMKGDLDAEILEKAARLIFGIARGQHFHEGNKRTALVAGLAFLQMNGFTMDIRGPGLVSVVDRAGVSTATLNDIRAQLRKLIRSV